MNFSAIQAFLKNGFNTFNPCWAYITATFFSVCNITLSEQIFTCQEKIFFQSLLVTFIPNNTQISTDIYLPFSSSFSNIQPHTLFKYCMYSYPYIHLQMCTDTYTATCTNMYKRTFIQFKHICTHVNTFLLHLLLSHMFS